MISVVVAVVARLSSGDTYYYDLSLAILTPFRYRNGLQGSTGIINRRNGGDKHYRYRTYSELRIRLVV